jgi:hypothetical protein
MSLTRKVVEVGNDVNLGAEEWGERKRKRLLIRF